MCSLVFIVIKTHQISNSADESAHLLPVKIGDLLFIKSYRVGSYFYKAVSLCDKKLGLVSHEFVNIFLNDDNFAKQQAEQQQQQHQPLTLKEIAASDEATSNKIEWLTLPGMDSLLNIVLQVTLQAQVCFNEFLKFYFLKF